MYDNPNHYFRETARGRRVRVLKILVLMLAAFFAFSNTTASADIVQLKVGPAGTIILAQTRDECIMRCAANRDLCIQSCSAQFDDCIARAGGSDDGSCGVTYRSCRSDCGEIGFNRCVTEQCYSLPN